MMIYDRQSLMMDAGRGLFGLAGTLGPILLVDEMLPFVEKILWVLAALFALYLIRIADRWWSVVTLSEDGIMLSSPGRTRRLAWRDIKSVKFSCYAIRRGSAGAQVMTLKLKGAGTKIVVESSLTGFDRVLSVVSAVCGHNGLSVDPTTAHNFEQLGVPIPQPTGDQGVSVHER